jgi:hypothetical protein
MTKVKEYVEIEGKRVAVTAENLIKAHKKMWKMQEELDLLRESVSHYEVCDSAAEKLR